MKRTHTRYSSEEKVSIVRRHLIDGVLVSDLCDEFGIQPTVFYRWQKQLFENGSKAFEAENRQRDRTAMRSHKVVVGGIQCQLRVQIVQQLRKSNCLTSQATIVLA